MVNRTVNRTAPAKMMRPYVIQFFADGTIFNVVVTMVRGGITFVKV